MKILYLEAKKPHNNAELQINPKCFKELPKTLFIAYSIQYKELAQKIKQLLSKKSYNITAFKQVLGCTQLKTNSAILLIGSGKFHALGLALQNKGPVYIYNNNTITQIPKKDIELLKKRKQAALAKLIMARKVGILVTTKPGQNKSNLAQKLKKQLEKHNKQAYIFISNNINLQELENFKIQSWINTACPGLTYDHPNILNILDLSSTKYKV
jgi:diphthamide biosynthesis enzyme Dph1/Dph2-like protein